MTASVFHGIQSDIENVCRYNSPIYGYLQREAADWKHPSFM